MRGEFGQQPVGQRLDRILGLVLLVLRRLASDGDGPVLPGGGLALSFGRSFILGTDIAAVVDQAALAVERDEHPGALDLYRIVDHGPRPEGVERLFDLAKTFVDLVGQFAVFGIVMFELVRSSRSAS